MSIDVELIKKDCLEKWQEGYDADNRLRDFSSNFNEWMEKIPDYAKEFAIILIKNLEYYSHPKTNKWLVELHKRLKNLPNVNDENTVYAFIKSKDGKSNSSNDYWTEYKAINEVNSEICFESLDAINDEQWVYIDNIVFIDDFGGSGKSFLDELKKNPLRYYSKNVYFMTIQIMSEALAEIGVYSKENNVKIIVINADEQKKAFERGLFQNEEEAKETVCKMSEEFGIPLSHHLGYKECQSLVAFYNNTPNNTLGFIRFDTDKYKSLFPRRNDKKPKWQTMKKNSRRRKKANYNNIKGDD